MLVTIRGRVSVCELQVEGWKEGRMVCLLWDKLMGKGCVYRVEVRYRKKRKGRIGLKLNDTECVRVLGMWIICMVRREGECFMHEA